VGYLLEQYPPPPPPGGGGKGGSISRLFEFWGIQSLDITLFVDW